MSRNKGLLRRAAKRLVSDPVTGDPIEVIKEIAATYTMRGGQLVPLWQSGPPTDGLALYLDARYPLGKGSGPRNLLPSWLSRGEASWTNGPNGTATNNDSTQALYGSASVKMTAGAAGNAHLYANSSQGSITPGKTYTLGAAFRLGNLASASVRIAGDQKSSSHSWLAGAPGPDVTATNTGWVHTTVEFTAVDTASYITIIPRLTAAAAGDTVYIDHIWLAEGKWEAGAWANVGTLPTNLLAAGPASGASEWSGTSTWGKGTVTLNDPAHALHGSGSLLVTASAVATDVRPVWEAATDFLTPGKTYTFGYSLRSGNQASCSVGLMLDYRDSTNTAISGHNSGSVTATNTGWTHFAYTVTAPANATRVSLAPRFSAAAVGDTVYIDNVWVAEGVWPEGSFSLPNMADGDPLWEWRDLSGHGRHVTQGTAAKRPAWRSQGRNLLSYGVATANERKGSWTVNAAVTFPASSTAFHGDRVMRVECSTAGPVRSDVFQANGLVAGDTFSWEARVRWASGATPVNGSIQGDWKDATLNNLGGYTNDTWTASEVTGGGWVRLTGTATVPEGAVACWFYVAFDNALLGDAVEIDANGVYEGALPAAWTPPVQTPNGQPVVQFDGVDDFLRRPTLGLPDGTKGVTVYTITAQPVPGSHSQYFFGYGPSAGGTGRKPHIGYRNGSQITVASWGGDWNSASFTEAQRMATRLTVGVFSNPRTVIGHTSDGTTRHTGQATNSADFLFTDGDLTIGVLHSNGNSPLRGDIAAVLVYEGVHTDAERKRVERSLAQTYGLPFDGEEIKALSVLKGLHLWLDSRYPRGIDGTALPADGDPLARWADLSGRARHVEQTTAASRPLWRSQGRNRMTYETATALTRTAGYTNGGTVTFPATSDALHGSTVGRLTADGTVADPAGAIANVDVTSGEVISYEVSFRWAAGATPRNVNIQIDWLRADNGQYHSTHYTSEFTSTTAWQRSVKQNVTVPDDVKAAGLTVRIRGAVANDAVEFDALGLYSGVAPAAWVPPVQTPNGQPVVQFDGVDDMLTNDFTWPNISTVYLVARSNRTNSAFVADGAGDQIFYDRLDAWGFYNGTRLLGPTSDRNVHVFSTTIESGGAATISVDGVVGLSGSAGTLTPTATVRIGNSITATTSYPLEGEIAAVLMYEGVHDDATRAKVEADLATIYGITLGA